MNLFSFFKKSFVWAVLLLFFQSCGSALPKKPTSISIVISTSGGMLPDYSQVYIGKDSCSIKSNFQNPTTQQQKKEEDSFAISQAELYALYAVFIQQQFDKIKERKEMVHDRGGVSISLTIDGKTINKSNGGTSFIEGQDLKRFQTILSEVEKLIAAKRKG